MFKITQAFFLLLLFFISNGTSAQSEKREKYPSYFGIQVRPVLASSFMASTKLVLESEDFITDFTMTQGYSFGGIVRTGITKLISFETGINYTQRNFDITLDLPDSGLHATNDMSFVNYDIPINALVYIQLSDQFFMNSSLGVALRYSPSSIFAVTKPGGLHTFYNRGAITSRVGLDLNANFGFEFRTFDKGFFYFGGTVQVPITNLFNLRSTYVYQGYERMMSGPVKAAYLALDFKYFFPNIKNKGPQPLRGPIQ
jgi:hypothetical protein